MPDRIEPTVWWQEVQRPALVLGSAQSFDVVDQAAADATATEVVRRRSGGGAVHLVPGGVTWVDVLLPADDRRWDDDIGRSFDWLGETWQAVLAELGFRGATVHRGPLVRTEWSDLVCFGGIGPGEVRIEGRKVVGLSQRRTRAGARFQCALLHQWDPAALMDLLAVAPEARVRASDALREVAAGIGPTESARVVATLLEVLGRSGA